MIISRLVIDIMKSTSGKCRENHNTHIFNNLFFPPANRAVCEIMWKNVIGPDGPQMTI